MASKTSVSGVVSLADMMNGGPNDDDASSTSSFPDTAKPPEPAKPPAPAMRTRALSFAIFGRRTSAKPAPTVAQTSGTLVPPALASASSANLRSTSSLTPTAAAAALAAAKPAFESAPSTPTGPPPILPVTPTARTAAMAAAAAASASPASLEDRTVSAPSSTGRSRSGFWTLGRRPADSTSISPPPLVPGPPSSSTPPPQTAQQPFPSDGAVVVPPALDASPAPPAAASSSSSTSTRDRRRSFGSSLSLASLWTGAGSGSGSGGLTTPRSARAPAATASSPAVGSVPFPGTEPAGSESALASSEPSDEQLPRRGANRYSTLFREAGPVPTAYGQRWSEGNVSPRTLTGVRRSNTGGTLDRIADGATTRAGSEASLAGEDATGAPPTPNGVGGERDLTVLVEHGAERVELHFSASALGCDVVRAACDNFSHWDDRQYTLFALEQKRAIDDSERIRDLATDGRVAVRLLTVSQLPALVSPRQSAARPAPLARPNSASSLQLLKRSSMALTGHGIGRLKKKLKPDSVYLSVVAFNSQNMQILLTANGLLPTVTLAHGHREPLTRTSEAFQWALRRSLDLELLTTTLGSQTVRAPGTASATELGVPTGDTLRGNFFNACDAIRHVLELSHLGIMFDEPIVSPASSISHLVFVVDIVGASTALHQGTAQVLRANTLRWAQVSDMSSLWYPPTSRLWLDFATVYRHRTTGLAPGLYLGVLYVQNDFHGIDVLVPKGAPGMIPIERLRDDPNVSPEEWAWMRGEGAVSPFFSAAAPTSMLQSGNIRDVLREERRLLINAQRANRQSARIQAVDTFRAQLLHALETLMTVTKLEWTGNDLYRDEALPIDPEGRVRVLLFVRPLQPIAAEEVVVVDTLHHMMLPFLLFEPMHQQVFNTRRATEHRRRTIELEQQIQGLQTQLEAADGNNVGAQRDTQGRLKDAVAQLSDVKKEWRQRTWLVRVMEWERGRSWDRMTIRRRPPSWMSLDVATPRSPSPGASATLASPSSSSTDTGRTAQTPTG